MTITNAMLHLVQVLKNYYPKDDVLAIMFLDALSTMDSYLEEGRLDLWETHVAGAFSDEEWEAFEQRPDFGFLTELGTLVA